MRATIKFHWKMSLTDTLNPPMELAFMFLDTLFEIAKRGEISPQALLADTMRTYFQSHEEAPRPSVMAHFEASLKRHHRLGELLAK